MHGPVLEFKNLNFRYNKNLPLVLKDLNLKIIHNELIALAGPNGCGKTTLIKHMNGLLKPNSGEILLFDKPVDKKTELTKYVGTVFQNPDEQIFFPIVEDDVAFGPRNLELEDIEIDKRVNEALKMLNIESFRKKSFTKLSFGEKKKVSLAGVFATKPEIMILDEPTIGIDPWSKPAFLDLMKRFKKHSSILIATHDPDVLKMVDKIYLMWDGSIVDSFNNFETFQQEAFKLSVIK